MQDVLAPVSRTASATVSKTGTAPSSAVWPPLPGVTPATIGVPYSSICAAVEVALAAGDALDDEAGLAPDEDAHARRSPAMPRRPWPRPRRAMAAVSNCASSSSVAASAAFVPTIRTTIGTSRVLLRARLDQAARDLVAAGDAAEDVDEDRVDLRVGQDDPHRRRDLVGPRAAADVEEVGRLAAGPLDEVHRRHREARRR